MGEIAFDVTRVGGCRDPRSRATIRLMHRPIVPQPDDPADDRTAALTTVGSPWGPLHVAVTRRGIAAVSWVGPVEAVREWLVRKRGLDVVASAILPPDDQRRLLLERTTDALERWLAGEPEPFDLPLDLSGLSPWDQDVLRGVRRIPWGTTESYGGVARMIGRAGAARAVGGAVGRNPIGVIIPCHRVIAGDGTLGGYGSDAWGSHLERQELKRSLLRVEGLAVANPTD
jgi:methylated-DNA-[protein]-cysteine S-methyltransferase